MQKQYIHTKAKTPVQKLLNLSNASAVMNILKSLLQGTQDANLSRTEGLEPATPQEIVQAAFGDMPSESPTEAKPKKLSSKSITKKPSVKMIVVKGFNPRTNAHAEAKYPADSILGLSFAEAIKTVRASTFPSTDWSIKLRIPVGL